MTHLPYERGADWWIVLYYSIWIQVVVVAHIPVGAVVVASIVVVVVDTPSGVRPPTSASETPLAQTPRPHNGLVNDLKEEVVGYYGHIWL